MSSANFSLYSAYYDLLYVDKKYAEESEFISALLKQYGTGGMDLLELGCGTGIHAVHLASKGHRVHGIDQSAEMLVAANSRKHKQEAQIAERLSFAVGDLRDFTVQGKFDNVISLFDVVSYLPENAAFKQSLGNIRSALRPGGLVIFDCWYGPAVYHQKPHVRVRRLEGKGAEVTRIAEPVFHHQRNVIDVNYDIFVRDKATGEISNFKEVHPMRCFFDAELDELMAQGGFSRAFSMEWFTGRQPSVDTWSVLFGYRLAGDSA